MPAGTCYEVGVNDFAVMDDSRHVRHEISTALQDRSVNVHEADSLDEVLKLGEQGVRQFILDIDMGPRRAQEGLEALERIKEKWPESFVAILTFSAAEFSDRAKRLKADLIIQKSHDQARDAIGILEESLRRKQVAASAAASASQGLDVVDEDSQALRLLMANPDWMDRYRGQYVGVVGGKVVFNNSNLKDVLEYLYQNFPDTPKYYDKVEEARRSYKVHSRTGAEPSK